MIALVALVLKLCKDLDKTTPMKNTQQIKEQLLIALDAIEKAGVLASEEAQISYDAYTTKHKQLEELGNLAPTDDSSTVRCHALQALAVATNKLPVNAAYVMMDIVKNEMLKATNN